MSATVRLFLLFVTCAALSACAKAPLAVATAPERAAISASLMRDITVLSSDSFGGRRPGTAGEEQTVAYLIEQMQSAGLVSGTNDPGSAWRAPVELVSSAPVGGEIVFVDGDTRQRVDPAMASAFTSARRLLVESSPMIFVGFESDDVDSESIAGKVVVMLGEPGQSPQRRAELFKADPAAIITVIEDEAAISGLNRAFGRERLILQSEDEKRLTGFVTHAAMRAANGADHWDALVEEAAKEDFSPGPLEPTVSIDATSNRREFASSNVLGLLAGSVPGSGAVLLMAHWDHLGECGNRNAGEDTEASDDTPRDLICNGAVDNASGVAVMLELARRLAAAGPHDRDIYVLATTAEESGLLGAKAFAEAPPIPLDTIVAAFNFDTSAIAPAGSPVGFVGEGRTPLDTAILEIMAQAGRELGDKQFAESFVRRQDGWALLDKGVPAVFLSTAFGSEIALGPYLERDYHRPSDEVAQIELGGAVDDLLLHEVLVRRFASTAAYPAGDK